MYLIWRIALVSTVLLAACATSTERWVQPGKTDAEAEKAAVQCEEAAAPKPRAFSDPVYRLPSDTEFKQCMESKGYTRVEGTR